MPKIERLQQNTPDWHRWRQQGLGASDAPVIMGDAAFKTTRMLWSIKTGRMQEEPPGPAARRGRELERLARQAYEQELGIQMEPLCLVHDELEWMRASLDGLSFDGSTVLEIKCPMNVRDQSAARAGSVPPHYYAQLQSISTETPRSSNERIARVVMNYRFVDARSGEELTVRVAGEGADTGDKAPYKAMTGALKYALLQSFLLASGDDPEEERGDMRNVPGPASPTTPEQVRELEALIEQTGTELERVLAYYKVSALNEMSEVSYRRALELLNRKLAKQNQENGVHA